MPSRGARRKTPRTAIWVQRSRSQSAGPPRDPAVAFHLTLRYGATERNEVVAARPEEDQHELISRTQASVQRLLDEARLDFEHLVDCADEENRELLREHEAAQEFWRRQKEQWNRERASESRWTRLRRRLKKEQAPGPPSRPPAPHHRSVSSPGVDVWREDSTGSQTFVRTFPG
jgi:hypothetical protein